ncbi:uncharacterized protein N0V96_007478 [Colletotrichum fioriniae]|uniref:uncharacterized protein n=1 Tax=Colletotrichum fioriniae TaxID=710243 RepID=UPI0032DACAB6|nr:hypothetical protein N0V96_007478 [Colletotrichum fioriniae]
MDALGHWDYDDTPQHSGVWYECDDCYDRFHDEQDLRDHEVEEHNYCDPCDRYFTNQNNIRLAPLDRDKLYQAVRARDPNGVICKKLLEWHASPIYTATNRTYNYHIDAYECYLCHRAFSSLNGLNQHLNSPVHQQKLYHCPNHRCGREYTTLAAVINHLESESCGYMRFKAVQKNVGQILDPRRMLSL